MQQDDNRKIELQLKDEVIKQVHVSISIKTLGVYVNPMLDWKDQFECITNKIIVTIKKLMRTEMKTHQVHMCFNTCMLTNVFFGCDIVKFNEKQLREFKIIYEIPMIRKLGLGDNFLGNSCMRRKQD